MKYEDLYMIIELISSSGVAKIDTTGAELISFMDVFGTEYIWQQDPEFWASSSPLLFPIVGNLRDGKVMIEGKEYAMTKHGFCRGAEFKVVYSSKEKAIFNYTFNEETLAMYPYKFSLSVTYSLINASLSIKYDVINLDDKKIYYCLGAHPAFNIPLQNCGEFEEYCLEFNKEEDLNSMVYDLENLEFNPNNRNLVSDDNKKIDLRYNQFDQDAVYFDTMNSNVIELKHKLYGRGISMECDGFTSIAFWTPIKKNAPFLCIEPWNGCAVCSDEDNEFSHKRGVIDLEVNQQKSHQLIITPL